MMAYCAQVWGRCEALTAGLSSDLAEQLRLVLEPQLASKMAGEYRTGKRISMKRVIAYIASHFRKDKIWLRRTRPDKRKYQASHPPLLLPPPSLPCWLGPTLQTASELTLALRKVLSLEHCVPEVMPCAGAMPACGAVLTACCSSPPMVVLALHSCTQALCTWSSCQASFSLLCACACNACICSHHRQC